MGGLIFLAGGLGAACLTLALLRWREHRRIRQLTREAEDFLNHGGKPMDVALGEDDIAMLQNEICELQDRLIRARELQKEECSRTSSLTADISHQLKTPLTTLRVYTELDAAPHMEASLAQISRMENLIQGLLRLERLCADGYSFTLREQDMGELIGEQWSCLTPAFPGRNLELSGQAVIRCDGKWMGEAFGNLLKNACEHTAPGGTVWVCLEKTDAAFFCTLEDDGGGVPEKDLSHLFERFYRAEHQSTQGAGIGLSIVREIVRRHHGTITASNTGRGLRMEITLPILEAAHPM
ncbi:MAG: sensor histidine kinase [Faecousia sp.]